ncbi:carbon-nitrogen family hydrolase [Streptomyces sp. NPDC059578]|uniref:carbon-nitrogen family hydrolase n=1 Tax=Streptomyces sp. NPDC059578 TaxID=3346874 RepID=UPI0036BB04AC
MPGGSWAIAAELEGITMEIALLQAASPDGESQLDRIDRIARLLSDQQGADLVVLPELWSAGYFHFDDYPRLSEPLDGPTVRMCQAAARSLGAHVHIGSIVERTSNGALRNTSLLLDPSGTVVHQYSKIHVFGYQSQEAQLLTPGDALPVADSALGRIAGTTCYDLRFPGLWSELSVRGAEIVVVPAAWPAARREHWRLLTSTRALEHQVFVIACNAAGQQNEVQLAGTSRVVDPFGRLIAEAGEHEQVLRASVDLAEVAATRAEFPVIADRLPDYANLSK